PWAAARTAVAPTGTRTRSPRASTRSSRSTCTCPGARPGPRPCSKASSCCKRRSGTRTWPSGGGVSPLSSPDDTRPEGPPPGDVAPIESEPVGAEVPQPPAAADDARPDEPTSDTQGTGVDSEIAEVESTPAAEHPTDDTAATDTAAVPEQPAAAPAPSTDPEEAPAPPVYDDLRTPVLEALAAKLGDAVVATEVAPGRDCWARIRVDAWGEAARVLREELGFTYFCYLSAIDWLPSPYGKSEDDTAPAVVDPSAP